MRIIAHGREGCVWCSVCRRERMQQKERQHHHRRRRPADAGLINAGGGCIVWSNYARGLIWFGSAACKMRFSMLRLELISRAQFSPRPESFDASIVCACIYIGCIPHLSGSFRRRRLAIKSVCWRRKLNQNCFLISCMVELGNNARPGWMIARFIETRTFYLLWPEREKERLILKICTRRSIAWDTTAI